VQQVPRRELEGVDAELRQEIGARLVERRRDEGGAFLVRVPAELEPVALRELESLTMLAVRRAEAVLVVVWRLVERTREETAVVALLELDRIDAALTCRVDERLRLLEVALVVVPDLGDDVRGAVPRYHPPVDDQLAHGAIVLGRTTGIGSPASHGGAPHGNDRSARRSNNARLRPPAQVAGLLPARHLSHRLGRSSRRRRRTLVRALGYAPAADSRSLRSGGDRTVHLARARP